MYEASTREYNVAVKLATHVDFTLVDAIKQHLVHSLLLLAQHTGLKERFSHTKPLMAEGDVLSIRK